VRGSDALPVGTWEGVVSVRDDLALTGELNERLGKASGRRAVGVTDLLSLRPAFYRAVAPAVPIPSARRARLEQGRVFHRVVGARLASEGVLEARARRDGLVGRVDILADVPIEVKTVPSLLEVDDLVAARPEYFEQLAMYSALVAHPGGRLLTVLVGPTGVSDVRVADVTFGSTDRILHEMHRRAEQLRDAWANSRATDLPKCPWFGRGCEFGEAGICGCTGGEPEPSVPLVREIGETRSRPDLRERFRAELAGPVEGDTEDRVGRFRELLYPRRAYFERVAPRQPQPAEPSVPALTADLYGRLMEALEGGPAGEVARLPTPGDEADEEVVGFRGRPLLVRTSRASASPLAKELLARAPQYVLELGLRCAIAGSDSGIVVVGYERASPADRPIRVYEVGFSSLTPFSRLFRDRRRMLRAAVRGRDPSGLPPCPEWMVRECPYRAECGCDGSDPRFSR